MLTPGLGAVATTTIAGVELARRGLAPPVGSLSQLGRCRLGQRTERRVVPIRELVPLADLDDIVFDAWDLHGEDGAAVAQRSGVLRREHLELSRDALAAVRPRPAAHDPERVRRLAAPHAMQRGSHRTTLQHLRADINEARAAQDADRAVMILTSSTETRRDVPAFAGSWEAMLAAIDRDDPDVSPSMLYAAAALLEGVPFANATPNLCAELPALQQLATENGVPVAGKDLKSGQTLMKTALAPALRARMLGLTGWFSTNILGNRDGEVLDDPEALRSKEITRSGVLDAILQPEVYPQLYGGYHHKVATHYYPPRGDEKEGWDAIDIVGWLGYPMQIKVNFQCRDSVLAAPLVLDLALFLDLAARAGRRGPQEWLSFYFKSPMAAPPLRPEHDLFVQLGRLESALCAMAGEDAC